MLHRLRIATASLEAQRNTLIQELSGWDEADLRSRPIAGKWSAIEILEHLALAEREVMRGVYEPEWRASRERTLRDRVSYWGVMFVLRSPIRVQAPSDAILPTGRRSFTDLSSDWSECGRALSRFVTDRGTAAGELVVSEHPIAGPMTLREAVNMGRVHTRLHADQVARLARRIRLAAKRTKSSAEVLESKISRTRPAR